MTARIMKRGPEPAPKQIREWSASLRALPELENRQWRAKASERYGRALTEGLLMASRDGVTFKRWNEGFLRPGIERSGTWNYGHQTIAWHPVETRGTLEGAPNELSFFAVESYWTGTSDLLRRYTLRLDGFVSVNAPMSGGELITQPVTFTGNQLWLNFATSAAGSVQVELQDQDRQTPSRIFDRRLRRTFRRHARPQRHLEIQSGSVNDCRPDRAASICPPRCRCVFVSVSRLRTQKKTLWPILQW